MSRGRTDVHYENIFDRHINFRERVIYLNDDVDESSLGLILKAFDEMENQKDLPIKIEVSSYGGSVYDMLGIVDRIKSSPCTVITRGLGKIMSAATFILAAGDERSMGKNATLMIHQISDWITGTLSEMKIELRHTVELEDRMNRLYEELSQGKTKRKTFEKLCSQNCYLTAEQTLKLGLIDKVL